jgi:hypothetical protein
MTVKGERVLKAAAVIIFLVMIAALTPSAWAANCSNHKPETVMAVYVDCYPQQDTVTIPERPGP